MIKFENGRPDTEIVLIGTRDGDKNAKVRLTGENPVNAEVNCIDRDTQVLQVVILSPCMTLTYSNPLPQPRATRANTSILDTTTQTEEMIVLLPTNTVHGNARSK